MNRSGYYDAFGSNPNPAKQVGWRSELEQALRFEIALDLVQPGDSLLDLGCGTGALGSYLRKSGWTGRYIGVDAYPHARLDIENSEFLQMDFTRMEPISVDIVVAIGALVGNTSHTALESLLEHVFRAQKSLLLVGLSKRFLNSSFHDNALEGFELSDLPNPPQWHIDEQHCLITDTCVVGHQTSSNQFRGASQWLERAKANVKWSVEELAWVCAQLGLEEELLRLRDENPENEVIEIAYEKWQFWHKIRLA